MSKTSQYHLIKINNIEEMVNDMGPFKEEDVVRIEWKDPAWTITYIINDTITTIKTKWDNDDYVKAVIDDYKSKKGWKLRIVKDRQSHSS